ncbi:MAG: hypothetical protein J7L45_02040 [Candidatus Aenigmarchaeota archaeon]|nr:hypothetical protein [Candidatus Aenigmarchaeota archaeon]
MEFQVDVYSLEKMVEYSADKIHSMIKEFKKYKEMSDNNEKIKSFLGVSYIWTARWQEENKKFDLEEKIVSIGEDFMGISLSLDDLLEGKFPERNQKEVQIISDMIYSDNENPTEFVLDLKKHARKIHEILTGNINKPRVYG